MREPVPGLNFLQLQLRGSSLGVRRGGMHGEERRGDLTQVSRRFTLGRIIHAHLAHTILGPSIRLLRISTA